MDYALRFWSETMTPHDVVDEALGLLARHGVGVTVSMYPVSLTRENAAAFKRLREEGVEFGFWPLLEKGEGYFPNERNAQAYSREVRRLMKWARENDIVPDLVIFDLELPLEQMRWLEKPPRGFFRKASGAMGIARENLDRERYYRSKAVLEELNDWTREQGARTMIAVMPWVAFELEGRHELLQDLSESPASGIDWDVISPMHYTTMLVASTDGFLTARDANWLLYDSCLKLTGKFGSRAGVSLGLTGSGPLLGEPAFKDPAELMAGLEAALAAGVRDISVYSLEGVLDRADPEEWFEAMRRARPMIPPRSGKVAGGLTAARAVYPPFARLIQWYRRPP
jgi:hypothetical protein